MVKLTTYLTFSLFRPSYLRFLRRLARQSPQSRRPDVLEVLRASRISNIPLSEIFSADAFANALAHSSSVDHLTPLDAINVFVSAASLHGDESTVEELLLLRDQLDGGESAQDLANDAARRNAHLDELEPTRSNSKEGADGGGNEILFNLKLLKENLSAVGEARARHSSALARQRWLEESAFESARKRLEHAAQQMEELGLSHTSKLKHHTLQQWMWSWYTDLSNVLEVDLKRIEDRNEGQPMKTALPKASNTASQGSDEEQLAAATEPERKTSAKGVPLASLEHNILPFLRTLPVKKLALIPILEIMRMQSGTQVYDGMKTTRVLLSVGRAIEHEYFSERRLKTTRARSRNGAEEQHLTGEDTLTELQWSQQTRARVGSYLVQHLMEVAKVPRSARDRHGRLWEETQPAFYAAYQYVAGKKLGVIRLNDALLERLDKDTVVDSVHPRHLPMLVPPRPWTHHNDGGYLHSRSFAMRFKDSAEQAEYLREADERQELSVLLAGLDTLGQTGWRINESIFDAVTKVWNSGVAVAEIPPATHPLPEPERPDNYDSTDMSVRKEYVRKLRKWNAQRSSFHSQRCDVNYKLEIAKAFIGERFYFPHNMDFRGRAYPIPPLFNHIGNDLCRGLLLFDKAKPLGKQGLRWLRIHVANVYGYDKANFAEREKFALEHEKEIRASANDPLSEEGKWWQKADDPWQCLAACKELVNAYDNPEGPELFESRLPVHQDGTCNGLQHYAALGGDLQGAQQVNLSGGERPSDVYTGVATMVIDQIERDAADPNSPYRHIAKLLQGKVTRKVVKQTVMTTVYGVTFIGAKNQIYKQLSDRDDTPMDHRYACATYLASAVLACIGDLFKGAESIQQWLTHSARLIARSIPPHRVKFAAPGGTGAPTYKRLGKEQMTAVIWSTPLNLPVVQPYRKAEKKQVATSMQSVYINDPNRASEVNPAKQASAFPPNFIHSLDATHMFLTALECSTRDLVFASVHDSYWTHACDIDTMSDIIRDTFVRLHSSDILPKLRDDFLSRYAGYKVPVQDYKMIMRSKRGSKKGQKTTQSVSALGVTAPKKSPDVSSAVSDSADPIDTTDAELDNPLGETLADSQAVEAAQSDIEEKESKEMETHEEQEQERVNENEDDAAPSDEHPGFLPLANILPPLPQKGAFDVNEIRRSLYFFS